jgi:hypothetical protein
MRLTSTLAILAAASLAVSPAAAAPRPTGAPGAKSEVAPQSEQAEGDQIRRRGFLLPLAIIIAIILGVILLTGDDETPASP